MVLELKWAQRLDGVSASKWAAGLGQVWVTTSVIAWALALAKELGEV